MSRILTSTLTLGLLAAACGGPELGSVESSESDGDAISASTAAYVTLRRDFRRCVAPMCGGWWLSDVNRSRAEVYASGLDFSQSNLDELSVERAQAGEELVIKGKLGPRESRFGTRPLIVLEAYRGLPGITRAAGDAFYAVSANDPPIQCFAAPCNNDEARLLNRTRSPVRFTAVDPTRALLPFVDERWAVNRVETKGAIVAGHFEDGAQFPAGRESLLVASQIFVRIPDRQGPCPLPPIARCPEGLVNVFGRTADRCMMPAGCAVPGVCAAFSPSCEEGYTLASWSAAPNACPAFACDPSFTLPEEPPVSRCARVRCAAGTHCVEEGEQACVPNATCAETSCGEGTHCVDDASGGASCWPDVWTPEAVSLASASPYRNGERREWIFTSDVPGTEAVRLHFTRFDLERGYDFVTILSMDGAELERLTGRLGELTTRAYPGSAIRIVFTTDGSVTASGFAVDHIDALTH